jgi:hypothetical protein
MMDTDWANKFHHSSSNKRMERFRFLQESRAALPKLEEQSVKRRHEFHTRIHELECQRMGQLAARLAHERMDRDLALRGFLDKTVSQPLQTLVERVMGSKLLHVMDNERTRLMDLSNRLSKLETMLMKHKHVTLQDARHHHLHVLYDELVQEVQPALRLEASKADKREGSMVRRFESIAGIAARRYQEETSSCKAALSMLESELAIDQELDEVNTNDFLESIKTLRLELEKERKERKERDKEILRQIHESTVAMKRALLEAAGDDDNLIEA